MRKTILALLTAGVSVIVLVGCSGNQGQDADGSDADDSAHATEQHGHDSHNGAGRDADGQEAGDNTHAVEQHEHDSHGGAAHDDHASTAGSPGDPDDVNRTVEISMNDNMRFMPDRLTFDAGDTVRLVVRNNGNIPHEFVIGSMSELIEHAKMMRAMPTMQHSEANMLTLAAATEGEIVWHFEEAGSVDFACLIPGHLEAGMKGIIEVE